VPEFARLNVLPRRGKVYRFRPGLPRSFQGSGQATDPSDGSRDGVSVLWLKAPADVLREWF